jgi:hypothetical protein
MFVPKRADATVLVRGAYFRICADGTLRGPDNAISATYADGLWELGHRRYTAFECNGPVHLRVTDASTRRECLGPYDFVKVVHGAIFTHGSWLGAHAPHGILGSPADLWQEVAFLLDI